MFLIPMPSLMREEGKGFAIKAHCRINLNTSCRYVEYEAAGLLKDEIEKVLPTAVTINKSFDDIEGSIRIIKTSSVKEDYEIRINESGVTLTGGSSGIFWGIQTLRQIIKQCGASLPGLFISDSSYFGKRGFYHDVTRGKVPKLETLKELVDRISFYKINTLQLYVEHSFAFKNLSEAWSGKDPLTAEDILELDRYCRSRHVELIPSLATFGHLFEILTTKSYSDLCELDVDTKMPFCWYDRMAHHTINVSDEEGLKLVKSMLNEFIPLFSSSSFNICCDETFDIGKGKSAELLKNSDAGKLYIDFLSKICSYVENKGKKVMFWGDIILKHPEYLSKLPKNIECLYWNYDADVNEDEVRTLSKSGVEFQVCPGVCGWNRLMNRFEDSFSNITKMISYGKKYGAGGVLNTDWGDYGHINLFASSIPGMAVGAALSWNPYDTRSFEEYGKAYSAIEYGEGRDKMIALLNELSLQQVGTWADIVCWRESALTENSFLKNDLKRLYKFDETKMLLGYKRAFEIENELVSYGKNINRRLDMREFIVSAHGIGLFNAACLAIKKYHFRCGKLEALEPRKLACELEYWYEDYSALWRERNKESELYRIKETVKDLCSFLRDQNKN